MKKTNNILIFIFSLASVCFFIKDLNIGANDRLLPDIAIILVFFLPRIFCKFFKFKLSEVLEFIYILFIIMAHFFGSIVDLYNITWWYDLFAHFITGIVVAILSLLILNWFNMYKKDKKLFNFLYIIMFVLLIASLWEFLEFGADTFLKMNVQHSDTTGVSDTMEDMLIAFLGSIVISIMYIKTNIIEKVVNTLK